MYRFTIKIGLQTEIEVPVGAVVREIVAAPFEMGVSVKLAVDQDQKRTVKRRFVLAGAFQEIPKREFDRTQKVGEINGLHILEVIR